MRVCVRVASARACARPYECACARSLSRAQACGLARLRSCTCSPAARAHSHAAAGPEECASVCPWRRRRSGHCGRSEGDNNDTSASADDVNGGMWPRLRLWESATLTATLTAEARATGARGRAWDARDAAQAGTARSARSFQRRSPSSSFFDALGLAWHIFGARRAVRIGYARSQGSRLPRSYVELAEALVDGANDSAARLRRNRPRYLCSSCMGCVYYSCSFHWRCASHPTTRLRSTIIIVLRS